MSDRLDCLVTLLMGYWFSFFRFTLAFSKCAVCVKHYILYPPSSYIFLGDACELRRWVRDEHHLPGARSWAWDMRGMSPRGKGRARRRAGFTEWCASSLWRDPKRQEEDERRKRNPILSRGEEGSLGVRGHFQPTTPQAPQNFTLDTCLSWTKGQFSFQK